MSGYRTNDDSSLAKYDSEVSSAQGAPAAPRRAFTLKSNVADNHARTVAALHAPETPSEVNNPYVYIIGVSESSPTRGSSLLALVLTFGALLLSHLHGSGRIRVRFLSSPAFERWLTLLFCRYDTGFFGGTIALGSFRDKFGFTKANSSTRSANLVSLFQVSLQPSR